jgi:hypothetical protein
LSERRSSPKLALEAARRRPHEPGHAPPMLKEAARLDARRPPFHAPARPAHSQRAISPPLRSNSSRTGRHTGDVRGRLGWQWRREVVRASWRRVRRQCRVGLPSPAGRCPDLWQPAESHQRLNSEELNGIVRMRCRGLCRQAAKSSNWRYPGPGRTIPDRHPCALDNVEGRYGGAEDEMAARR